MPFVANYQGENCVPEEVPNDAQLTCLDCGDELRVRRTHERNHSFVARHFFHPNGGRNCSGGESATHRKLKSVVLSKLKQLFPHQEAGLERKIGDNIADVYLTFVEPMERYGDGIVAEVQYRNETKDRDAVTENYLTEGFSVCWLDQPKLRGKDIDLSEPEWYYYSDRNRVLSDLGNAGASEVKHNEHRDPSQGVCQFCDGEVSLIEFHGKSHAYEPGNVYECPQCQHPHLVRSDPNGPGNYAEPVTHRGNLTDRKPL